MADVYYDTEQVEETEMTSTVVDDLRPPADNITLTTEDCDDPEQACYYAHLLRVINVLDLYLLPLISVVGSKSGSQFASASRSAGGWVEVEVKVKVGVRVRQGRGQGK